MSFQSALSQVEIISARSKVDRLLAYLPEEESDALKELLLSPTSGPKVAKIIRAEGAEQQDSEAVEYFDISISAIKRWRDSNPTIVDGL